MDSNDEEEDLPTADLNDLVWSEEPIPDSHQQLCIHQIPNHTPRPAIPPPKSIQEEVSPELEQMDIKVMDDLPNVINIPKELLPDFDSWAHSVLE